MSMGSISRPVVLVPTRTGTRDDPDMGAGLPIQSMNQAYISALQRAGAIPLLVPVGSDLPADLGWADGVLLPGGADIAPKRYGAVAHPTSEWDDALDTLEFGLIDWALSARAPILGVCRGLQALNVALGGTMCQDLPSQRPDGVSHPRLGPRNRLVHQLLVEPGTRLQDILGGEQFMVNSLHHQGIDRLGDGLVASARSEDGLVEGIETATGPYVVGVQFHPEELAPDHQFAERLFHSFVAECAQARSDRVMQRQGAALLG
jgi:putative glutamine amidotransferase